MKKTNIQKLEVLAADWLQYIYGRYLYTASVAGTESDEALDDLSRYIGATEMLQAVGIEWKRFHDGGPEQQYDISTYTHQVYFPTDEEVSRMKADSYK